MVKNLIVGAGFSGAVLANKIATELDEDVLVIDAKNHIAGNCYDYWDKNGICVHQYGTHIFHTNLHGQLQYKFFLQDFAFLFQFEKYNRINQRQNDYL